MSQFDVVIPTYKRVGKLKKCLESLRNQTFRDFNIIVVADNNCAETRAAYNLDELGDIGIIFNETKEKAPRIWNRYLRDNPTRSIVYICDDVELEGDCLENLFNIPQKDDLLIGFNQFNLDKFCKVAMGYIGSNFANKFKDRQVFCPDYDNMHVDGELLESAVFLNGFFFAENCKLTHHHPISDVNMFDETHDITRENSDQDRLTRDERKKRGLIWGISFERTNTR